MSDIEGNMNAFKINCDGCGKAAEKKTWLLMLYSLFKF